MFKIFTKRNVFQSFSYFFLIFIIIGSYQNCDQKEGDNLYSSYDLNNSNNKTIQDQNDGSFGGR